VAARAINRLQACVTVPSGLTGKTISHLTNNNTRSIMSNTAHTALSLALLAVLALAAPRAEAVSILGPNEAVIALAEDLDIGDGRPPTPGPTNPQGLFR
jgi:hypothetical protein